jgi:hypothetical protein
MNRNSNFNINSGKPDIILNESVEEGNNNNNNNNNNYGNENNGQKTKKRQKETGCECFII